MMAKKRNVILITIIFGLLVLISSVSANQQITVSNAAVTGVGNTQTVTITLDQAPYGLSGYNLTVTAAKPAVAQVKSVVFHQGSLCTQTQPFPLLINGSAQSICHKVLPNGTTNILLATLTVQSTGPGSTQINVGLLEVDDNWETIFANNHGQQRHDYRGSCTGSIVHGEYHLRGCPTRGSVYRHILKHPGLPGFGPSETVQPQRPRARRTPIQLPEPIQSH